MTMRGRFKLVHNGYEYTEQSGAKNAQTTTWRCVRSRRQHCKGKAITKQIDSKQMIKTYNEHDHPPRHT